MNPNQYETKFSIRINPSSDWSKPNFQSELIWMNPSSEWLGLILMRTIPNQSEKRFLSRLMKNGQKSIRLNPINSETSIRMNPNQHEIKFSIWINPSSDWTKPSFQLELIWMNPSLEWLGLILMRTIPKQSEKRFVSRLMKNCQKSIPLNTINSEASIQMNLTNPNQSKPRLIQTVFSIRINLDESKVGMTRINSDANHSEPIWKTFCISLDEKRSKINPTYSK